MDYLYSMAISPEGAAEEEILDSDSDDSEATE